jgi:hypothetical protein
MELVANLDMGVTTGQDRRLAEAIRGFAAGAAPARETFHSGPDALAAILRAIDATVLPRALTISGATGDVVRLLVSNRRLMRVCTISTSGEPAIAPSDPEIAAREFAAALGHGLAAPGPFRLRRARSDEEVDLQGVGCDAGRLAAALPPLPVSRPAANRFGRFVDLLEADAQALVRLSARGEVLARRDTPQTAPLLAELLLKRAPATRPGHGPRPEPEFKLLEGPDGLDLTEAEDGGERLICLSPIRARDRVIAAWVACYRQG